MPVSPEWSRPKRIVSEVPSVSVSSDISSVGPALDAARPAGLTADDEGYEQYAENVPHHISPRPVFLSFPSSVSASTILSSTPLIKVLLPGVE